MSQIDDLSDDLQRLRLVNGSITVHTKPNGSIGFRMRWYPQSEAGVALDPQTIDGTLPGWPTANLIRDLIREATGEGGGA